MYLVLNSFLGSMTSNENSLKRESEFERGKVRLILDAEAGGARCPAGLDRAGPLDEPIGVLCGSSKRLALPMSTVMISNDK